MEGIWTVILICTVLAALCVYAGISYGKKLKSGCCGSSGGGERRVQPSDRDLSHYAFAYQVDIQGMHCKNCATQIENAYNRKEGFWAQVDFKQNRALVRTKRPGSENELRQIVWQAGYSAGSVQPVRR